MRWSGAICLEIQSMLVEVRTEITNMRDQVDEFHKEKKNNGDNGRNEENKDKWEDGYSKLETIIAKVPFPGLLRVRHT